MYGRRWLLGGFPVLAQDFGRVAQRSACPARVGDGGPAEGASVPPIFVRGEGLQVDVASEPR